jgi:diaminopimelate decarboxylase
VESKIEERPVMVAMKMPFVSAEQLREIVGEYPTPFHIYDEKGIRENARRLKAAFAWNPGYREYFAVKATPTPAILEILRDEGCGCDCSSMTELMLSERIGNTGERIVFSSNDTPAEEFRKAAELGAIINLDDFTMVDYLKSAIGYIPKKICCRYNPGGTFTLGETREGFQVMDNPGDAKYGMTRAQIAEAFRRLRAGGAEEFGIHAFLASNTLSNEYYPALSRILFQLAADLKRETGCHITFIDLSGGIGIPYRPEQSENNIAVIGEGVRKAYEEILTPAGMGDVALYTELGRFMLGPYGHLVTTAIHEKHIYKEYIGVDACACNLMRPAMYGAYHHITVMGREQEPCDHKYDVVGSLCENNDKFAVDRMLPEIHMGDLLVIHDTGAHGFSMGYNYNGKLRSAELLLREDGSVKLIRRAETPEDYFSTMIWD